MKIRVKEGKKMPLLLTKPSDSSNYDTSYEQRERLRNDYKWISEQKVRLTQDFINKYVAVKDKHVVLAEDDVYTLFKKLRASGLNPDKVAVEYVSEQPICFLL
jgi:hypothetical protein